MSLFSDTDNQETQEWLASLSSVIEAEGNGKSPLFDRGHD